MPAIPNLQPLFTFKPILNYLWFDTPVPDSNAAMNLYQPIYTDTTDWGSLITRITVNSSAVKSGDYVSDKIIYIGLKTGEMERAILYKSANMLGTHSYITGEIVPFVEFTFGDLLTQDGLVTKPGDIIVLGASTNSSKSTASGDYVNVVVEGGTYDRTY